MVASRPGGMSVGGTRTRPPCLSTAFCRGIDVFDARVIVPPALLAFGLGGAHMRQRHIAVCEHAHHLTAHVDLLHPSSRGSLCSAAIAAPSDPGRPSLDQPLFIWPGSIHLARIYSSGQDLFIWPGFIHPARICSSGQDSFIRPGFVHPARICSSGQDSFIRPGFVHPARFCSSGQDLFIRPGFVHPARICSSGQDLFIRPGFVHPARICSSGQDLFIRPGFVHLIDQRYRPLLLGPGALHGLRPADLTAVPPPTHRSSQPPRRRPPPLRPDSATRSTPPPVEPRADPPAAPRASVPSLLIRRASRSSLDLEALATPVITRGRLHAHLAPSNSRVPRFRPSTSRSYGPTPLRLRPTVVPMARAP